MAIDDNKVYGLTGAQIKELPGKIEAVKGSVKVLTTDDYNANSRDWTDTDPANFNCIALWKLDAGVYSLETGLSGTRPTAYYAARFGHTITNNGPIWIGESRNGDRAIREYLYQDGNWKVASAWHETGERYNSPMVINTPVVDNLTSIVTTSALSANQGRVLKGLIDAIEIPTKTSDLTNDGSDGTSTYVEADELATVATTGAYTDITGTPTNVSDFTNDAGYQTSSQVSTAIGTETTARQNADVNLQGQIDAIIASSDVKDIVGTKAELNAYDTSTLGDKDIIKVLQDESENNATTYYRWATATSTFTLIGEEGPYYTKAEADTLLNAKADASTTYTKSEVDTALSGKVDNATLNDYATTAAMNTALASKANTADVYTKTQVDTALGGKADASTTYTKTEVDTALDEKANTADLATVATSGSYNDLDNLPTLPTVVQTTGTSETNVMSQNATTSMVFADPNARQRVQIGSNSGANGLGSVAIGASALANGDSTVAIGSNSTVLTSYKGSVALGPYSKPTSSGQVDISVQGVSSIIQNYSYNNSGYRLLTGLYDPQNAHDAANKEYVDNLVITYAALNGTAVPTTATVGTYVGQLYLDTTNDKMYYLSAIDTTIPEYTWEEIGEGPNIVQSTGTSTTDVMSQNAVTSMVFANPAEKTKVKIGGMTVSGNYAVGIGSNGTIGGVADYGVHIGSGGGTTNGESGVGFQAGKADGAYSIAYSGGETSTRGVFQIGLNQSWATTQGYNNSAYRLLTGLYDPQSDHDAATKGYVDTSITTAISGIVGVEFEVVQTLPATGDAGTIYLVPNQGTTPNIYDEYIYVNNAFEKIGTTEIDLSNYVTTTDLNTALADYTTTANLATVATTGDYNDLTNTPAAFTTAEWNALWA